MDVSFQIDSVLTQLESKDHPHCHRGKQKYRPMMAKNPLLIKERLGHEKIQTTLGTYGHLYPNTNLEFANKLTGVLQYTSASQSVANYTSNQHTAVYHREVNEK